MAIGDEIDLAGHDPAALSALKATVEGKRGLAGEAMWGQPVLAVPEPGRLDAAPARSWLGRLFGGGRRSAGGLVSLKDLRERFHAATLADDGDGTVAIGMPFGHVMILTGDQALASNGMVEQALTERMKRQFPAYVDPRLGVRVRVMPATDYGAGSAAVFLGYGVHVPDDTEAQIGRVEMRFAEGEDAVGRPVEPRLPDGRPAGFYRGQTGLAFGADETIAPAVLRDLPGHVLFYLGRSPIDELRKGARGLMLRARFVGEAGADRALPIIEEIAPGVDGLWDGAFRVREGRRLLFELRYSYDARGLRPVVQRPPEGRPALKITGLTVPPTVNGRGIARFWIDEDAEGRLIHSALQRRAVSMVVERGKMRFFDWTERAFRKLDRADLARLNPTVGFTSHSRPVVDATLRERGFGWLPLPLETQFGLSLDGRGAKRAQALDWLDHAGTIELRDGSRLPLSALVPDGTIEASQGRGVLQLQAPTGLFGLSAEAGQYAELSTVALRDGDTVVIGPLVMTYSSGQG